ncbi:DUF3426 domain-containing protein [Caulobacter sp. NIBR2454]|uniref:DUF3426 domain-containing protein n=1 Tax=Caulobacter sp. NIBR2454 TaxID=3015996 RepID=UPI0022B74053|nr:DUF3426 domain-containing protein [Caulobacter sp. NIBR2454]
MILTCPKCASRYLVPDDKVGSDGRAVRCAKCGNKWTAYNEQPLDLAEESTPSVFADVPPASEDDIEAELNELSSDLSGEELPKAFRARADGERKVRHAATAGIVWASVLGLMALTLVLAVVFRADVARVWPRTAGVYDLIGMPVNNVGLIIEGLKAQPSLEGGHAALTVTGVIRNIRATPVVSPPLQVSLLNPQGKRVAGKLAAAADPTIPAGEVRHFAIVILDPPSTARDLEIRFDLKDGAAKAAHAPLTPAANPDHAKTPALRGAKTEVRAAPQTHPEKGSHD